MPGPVDARSRFLHTESDRGDANGRNDDVSIPRGLSHRHAPVGVVLSGPPIQLPKLIRRFSIERNHARIESIRIVFRRQLDVVLPDFSSGLRPQGNF